MWPQQALAGCSATVRLSERNSTHRLPLCWVCLHAVTLIDGLVAAADLQIVVVVLVVHNHQLIVAQLQLRQGRDALCDSTQCTQDKVRLAASLGLPVCCKVRLPLTQDPASVAAAACSTCHCLVPLQCSHPSCTAAALPLLSATTAQPWSQQAPRGSTLPSLCPLRCPTHLVCLLNSCALDANLSRSVTLLLLECAWADLARQDLRPDVILLRQAQPHLQRTRHQAAAAGRLTPVDNFVTGQLTTVTTPV
jgi:hypothetical protein